MRITADGQVTIPEELREAVGLMPGTEVQLELEGDAIRIRRTGPSGEPVAPPSIDPAAPPSGEPGPPLSVEPYPGKGAALVAFTLGKATTDLTTEEIIQIMRSED